MTFLFSFFVESTKVEKKLEQARNEITARQHLQMRLQSVFSGISRETEFSPLYSKFFADGKKDSLIAIFDNGIDPDPAFSGPVIGRIYVDSTKNLSLAIWPIEKGKKGVWRKEILLPSVGVFEFEFLAEKKGGEPDKKEKTRSVNTTIEWKSRWPKNRMDAPSIIRLILTQENQKSPVHFSFLLPSSLPIVTYFEGGQKP
ncbi:MAG: hypothetical protein V4487_06515 [Chlamydiota bacterium]